MLVATGAMKLLDGDALDAEERLLLGGALVAWLEQGGDLVRDYLKLTPPRGSHATITALYRRLRSGGSFAEPPEPSSPMRASGKDRA